ncbi:MAG: hypothetical protein ACYS9X_21740 [Planctomycetota bacterium]|jgi:hypothetical protein
MRTRSLVVASGAAALSAVLSGCLVLPDRRPAGLGAGWLGAARTELGAGSGWVVDVSFPDPSGDMFAAAIGATRHDEDGLRTTVWRGSYGLRITLPPSFVIYDLSWAGHVDDRNGWGAGLRYGCGIGVFRERFEAYVLPAAYVWLGGKDDEFDAGVEGDIRLVAGVRF